MDMAGLELMVFSSRYRWRPKHLSPPPVQIQQPKEPSLPYPPPDLAGWAPGYSMGPQVHPPPATRTAISQLQCDYLQTSPHSQCNQRSLGRKKGLNWMRAPPPAQARCRDRLVAQTAQEPLLSTPPPPKAAPTKIKCLPFLFAFLRDHPQYV